MIVVDASTVLELLVSGPLAEVVRRRLSEGAPTLHAPQVMLVEVAQVLRRNALAGRISAERGRAALADMVDLGVDLYDHQLVLTRVWALRNSLTAYDATYVALAEILDAPLVTLDARLARSHGHTAAIELLVSESGS